jgi:hypothetical protein
VGLGAELEEGEEDRGGEAVEGEDEDEDAVDSSCSGFIS